ncbi:MAG: YjjG family noncanonical pyrimidine nucleotidase, partial [Clostridia bacterium]|nr:YjjG family noncanonical pyrimidine nucleotidase [Clostridia bacterium]
YKNVFLDLDDTVLDFKKGQHDALFLACGEFGLTITENDYKEYDRINKDSWKRFERREVEKAEMLVDRYRRFLNYKNAEGDPAYLNSLYAKYLSSQGALLPGAREGVAYLKSKYTVSIITNGNVNTQKGRLKAAGLEGVFDYIFISDEIGFRKPDLAFFDYALKNSGAKKEETIVVGDSPSSDILGARNCGLDAILFDYKGTAECPYPYIKRVRTWTEVCSIL